MKKGLVLLLVFLTGCLAKKPVINIGSKTFTESYVLAEILAQVIEGADEADVNRKFGLGATGIIYKALEKGDIDLYPEYSGTISETALAKPEMRNLEDIRRELQTHGLTISDSLGFNNTYALAASPRAESIYKFKTISDLVEYPHVVVGFSHEFMKRPDGLPGLEHRYGLHLTNVRAVQHTIAYQALEKNEIEITDVYSTDAQIEKQSLTVLKDDKEFFPSYLAVVLAKDDFKDKFPKSWQAIKTLEHQISEKDITHLNAQVEIEKRSFSDVARDFLMKENRSHGEDSSLAQKIWKTTKQHINLVGISLLFSILVGIPLGIISARKPFLGQVIRLVSGILQTIPSLALLCFLIPLFGIGTTPALVALFLYGLLPIVVGTFTGIKNIDERLIESAGSLGLTLWQKLRLVELPLASPQIMAGIRTSAIINIGTATLAALIGAGGYGSPIITGLALNDMPTIYQGAIPAAVLALLVHGLFEIIDRIVIPKGISS